MDEKSKLNDILPAVGFVRLSTILGNKRKGIPGIVPVSKSAWYAGIPHRFPPGLKLSPRCTVWKTADIRALIEGRYPPKG